MCGILADKSIFEKTKYFIVDMDGTFYLDGNIIPGADGFLLFLNFGFVEIGDFALDGLDGVDLIHRLHMELSLIHI